jgi:peptidoglycan/xylan/chitin deacetylase (PgdA/CDA1 family)
MSVSPNQALNEDTILNAFTVDLEDWYQGIELPIQSWKNYSPRVEVGLYRILELLDKYRVRATFFVLGWVAERYPVLVKEVAARGHELGSDGLSHEEGRSALDF